MTDTRLDAFLRAALDEDLGRAGDITSDAIVPPGTHAEARVAAREAGVVAGLRPALRVFQLIDDRVEATPRVDDGARVAAGAVLAEIAGPARALLAGERTALNLLGQLSGVATATRALVERVEGTRARVVDTRKTVPGLRALQKAAVVAGGGANHRMGLHDAVLIKDNHLAVAGSAAAAVRAARASVGPDVRVEVELETLDELEDVIEAGADIVMLDNMELDRMREAVERTAGRCLLEASGNVTPERIRAIAETGVDWISVGRVTHSSPALDVALDFEV